MKPRFGWMATILAAILLPALGGCTLSKTPVESEKPLVSRSDPIYDKRFANIDYADINLENFWREADNRHKPAPIPLTHTSVADVVDLIKDSVVNLYTLRLEEHEARLGISPNDLLPVPIPLISTLFDAIPFRVPVPFNAQGISLGSGFIINPQGYILTNAHVIQNATEIRVVMAGAKKEYRAKIIGADPLTDCALIKIDSDETPFPAIPLGNSDALRVGEMVLAVGNPMGLTHSVSSGMVSAKERIVPKLKDQVLDFIQTDSAINPGSSGGPLINMYGEVVGINTAIISDAQLIGFAIPIEIVKTVMPLLVLGKSERGWLGLSGRPLSRQEAVEAGLPEGTGGIVVTQVDEGSPAEKTGIRKNDVIVQLDGAPVTHFLKFRRNLLGLTPGRDIELGIVRDGKTMSVPARLANPRRAEP